MEIDDEMRRDLIEALSDYIGLLSAEGAGEDYQDRARDLKWRLENEKGIR